MADFVMRKQGSKTGTKGERRVKRLAPEQIDAGAWALSVSGSAHHFFIDGLSVCGRRPGGVRPESTARILCPECYASAGRPLAHD